MESTTDNKNHCLHNSTILAWKNIVKEVMTRKANGQKTSILSSDLEKSSFCVETNQKRSSKLNKSTYVLNTKHGGIRITKREDECIRLLLKGKTINNIASILKIAPRTAMDYISNIKIKVGCNTKSELINLVHIKKSIKSSL
jgi:DNA-binding CsgD family transcriptional regulator